jgi:hypothetical protein
MRRILRYIKNILQCEFFYEIKSQLEMHGYMDVDWFGNVSNRRSTNGFMFFFGSGAINNWSNKKQPIVTLLNTKVGYKCIIITTCEVIWLQKLLPNLGQSMDAPTVIYCDNINSINYFLTT